MVRRSAAVIVAATIAALSATWAGTATAASGRGAAVGSSFAPISGSFWTLSCGSPGNCSAGGSYVVQGAKSDAFVVNEKNGTWGTGRDVVPLGRLNFIQSLSCASAGNCSAGGYYLAGSSREPFVVNEKNGTWGKAGAIAGFGVMNYIQALSCGSAGNCVAAGYYSTSSTAEPFVVNEKNGIWGKAEQIPVFGTLDTGRNGGIQTISCPSAGNCSAGGSYLSRDISEAFVVSEKKGVWAKAEEVPAFSTLNTRGPGMVQTISCASAGNCSAGGYYQNSSGKQAFVVNEKNGVWAKAEAVPGFATLNIDGYGGVQSLSCASPANCSAGGNYKDHSRKYQVFVVNEKNGDWGTAEEIPGFKTLNVGGAGNVESLSCGSAGN